MEVGIEDCLHIEFEYNKSKYLHYFLKSNENKNLFHQIFHFKIITINLVIENYIYITVILLATYNNIR